MAGNPEERFSRKESHFVLLIQMLYMKKNPYVWSGSSQDVTSPVMSVSLNGGNNTAVSVGNLSDPVAISLTNFGE